MSDCVRAVERIFRQFGPAKTTRDRIPIDHIFGGRRGSISASLVKEDGKEQCPVYFMSKVLHGAEVRYSEVEKSGTSIGECSSKVTTVLPESCYYCKN